MFAEKKYKRERNLQQVYALRTMQGTSVLVYNELLVKEAHQGYGLVLEQTKAVLFVPFVSKRWLYFKLVLYKPVYRSNCLALGVEMEVLHPHKRPQLKDDMLHIDILLPSEKHLDKQKLQVFAGFLGCLLWKALDEWEEYKLEEKKLYYFFLEGKLCILCNSSCHLRLVYGLHQFDCHVSATTIDKLQAENSPYHRYSCKVAETYNTTTNSRATDTDSEGTDGNHKHTAVTSHSGEEDNNNPTLKTFRLMNSKVEEYNCIDLKGFTFQQLPKTPTAYFHILPNAKYYFFAEGFNEDRNGELLELHVLQQELEREENVLSAVIEKCSSTAAAPGIVSKGSIGVELSVDSSHFIDSLLVSSVTDMDSSNMGTLLSMFVAALLSRIDQLRAEIAAGIRELADDRDTESQHSQSGCSKQSMDAETSRVVKITSLKDIRIKNCIVPSFGVISDELIILFLYTSVKEKKKHHLGSIFLVVPDFKPFTDKCKD